MGLWLRTALAVAIFLLPGGFLFLFAYVAGRTFRARWLSAQSQGSPVTVRAVIASVQLRELVREARAVF